jgi:hypothetical protein
METDEPFVDEDMDDDSDYVIDTYVRMPVELVEFEDQERNIGLLVLDSQPDIDEFYREFSESEEEDDEEEEDENGRNNFSNMCWLANVSVAENHYTADYPDEEVDSDDEYDRNAYHYRTHNASDLEEFDEDDATFSDDDADATKYPWAKKPWMKRPTGSDVLEAGEEE